MTWLSFGPRTEHPGALRADILPIADVVADIRSLQFADASCDGVECYHVLEHLLPDEAVQAVGELYRVLKPGGELLVAVPDMAACALTLLKGDLAVLRNIYSPHPEPAQQHRWGYTVATLAILLAMAGFVDLEEQPHSPQDPHEIRMRARKP